MTERASPQAGEAVVRLKAMRAKPGEPPLWCPASDSGSGPSAEAPELVQYQSDFWASYLGVGFFTQLLAILVIEGYVEITHYRVHRSVLLGVAAVILGVTVVGLFTTNRIAGSRWRSQLSTVWCLISIASIGVFAYLDGGLSSPLLYLLALPVLYATAALELPEVRSCVLAAVFQPVWLAVINPKFSGPYGALLVLAGVVIGVGVLAVSLAGFRSRLQDQQRILTRELHTRSVTDGLTGCATSQAFHQRLDEEFHSAIRDRRQLSLLLCDVDLFKEYNDTHGHLAGDDLLVQLSSAIRHGVRGGDCVGRVGGDEFGVILPGTTEADAYLVAGRIMARVVKSATASLSIGVAAVDRTVASPADLYSRADAALYEAKRSGRGTLRISPADIDR